MVSSRSPGLSVTCSNSSDVPNNDLVIKSSSTEGPVYSPRNDNEPDRDLNNGRPGWRSESGPPSLSMSIDVHHATSGQLDSGSFSASPDRNNATSCRVKVTESHEVEERYEGFGSVEGDCEEEAESPGGSSSAPSPTGPSSLRNPRSPNSTIGRHTWLRTSLRRTPSGTSRKRLSSNALASQLYRSSSFNSSGRGSICDTADDMYSDVSLEDDVLDLNQRSSSSRPMVEKTTPSSSDRRSNLNYKNYPNPYQNYNPCDPYYHHPPPPLGPSYPHNYQGPCPCQTPNVPPSCCSDEAKKTSGSFKLPIFLFVLFIVSIIIAYNYVRGLLNQRNADISGRANPTFLLNQTPQSVAIGAQTLRIRKRDAHQNCPAEFVCCNNGIIEPNPSTEEDDLPQTSSPRQPMSRPTSVDRGRRTQIKNASVETSFNKLPKSQEVSSKNNKKSTGTLMTDDEKSAFLKSP